MKDVEQHLCLIFENEYVRSTASKELQIVGGDLNKIVGGDLSIVVPHGIVWAAQRPSFPPTAIVSVRVPSRLSVTISLR